MITFKQYLAQLSKKEATQKLLELFEHEQYKRIPQTAQSYREDPANTSTLTQRHAHVYAKLKGRGGQLYAINIDGSGHDGSSGRAIPTPHADFFRSKGYDIKPNNILENLDLEQLDEEIHTLIALRDA